MAQDIVGGLFGISPNDIMRQQSNAEMNAATNYANLNPFQQANYGGMLAGQMLGRGIAGVAGAEDPRLTQAKQIQQVKQWIASSGIDINTPEGLAQAAQYANSIGATEGAMVLGQQALTKRKSIAETSSAEENLLRGQQYRAAIAELEKNPNATEQDYINVARRFSGPEAGMTAAIQAESRKELKAAEQARKEQAATEQQKAAAEMAFGRAGTVMDAADKALKLVGPRTAGAGGAILGVLPGTDASDLQGYIETIKSNLATSELQKIREASKTGGALGNVSNKDVTLLETAVASLNTKQSPAVLKANIEKVLELYSKIQRDAGIKLGYTPQQPTTMQQQPSNAAPATTGWSIVSTK